MMLPPTDPCAAPIPACVFVFGGARSGKSALAERIAVGTGLNRLYVATAQALDAEMAERIARHRRDRGAGWTTVEAPMALGAALTSNDSHENVILIDCLTLWLSNVMLADEDAGAACDALCAVLPRVRARLVIVSNETGLGIVPDNALARRFRDAQGRLNQRVAALAGRVILVAAGLPLVLKG